MKIAPLICCFACLIAAVPATRAEEVELKGVSAFPEGTLYAAKFEAFVKQVNAAAKGSLRIRYLGGAPKVMSPFEVGKNLHDGIVDIASITGAFYTNVLPEADALKLLEVPMAELRKNGGWAYVNAIHNEKANAYYLARTHNHEQFHIYLNKQITKPDFTGLKIRVTPLSRAVVEKLGGIGINSAPTDVYTLLERNTVDGYAWAAGGIFDFGWEKVTKYRIDPGFYNADIQVLVNLDAWRSKLNAAQRKLLTDIGLAIESDTSDVGLNAAARKKQELAGIKVIRFSPADEKTYLETAREAGWEAVIKASPEHGPRLRAFFTGQH